MKKYIGKKIAQGVSLAVRKIKQADTKALNTLSKPFRRAPAATGRSTKARVAANDAARLAAQREVKPFYRGAQVLTGTGAAGVGAYVLNKKVNTEKKDTLKKGDGTKKTALQNSTVKQKPPMVLALPKPKPAPTVNKKPPNTVPPRVVKPVTQDWRQQAAKMKMAEKPAPAAAPKPKPLQSKSNPRTAQFLEPLHRKAPTVGGAGKKPTGYFKSKDRRLGSR